MFLLPKCTVFIKFSVIFCRFYEKLIFLFFFVIIPAL